MCATVLSLDAVRLLWYCLSRVFVLPNIIQVGGQKNVWRLTPWPWSWTFTV